jgi:hypothetical protein
MPKILHDRVQKLIRKGIKNPWAIATASLQKEGKMPKKKRGKRK